MPDDGTKENGLQYDRMVEEALRSVVGRSLKYAAKHGLKERSGWCKLHLGIDEGTLEIIVHTLTTEAKTIIGGRLRGRTLASQQTEATLGCKILNEELCRLREQAEGH